jgi:Glycosyl-4,4'-diaponeurosporenoate acyltransferase
VKTHLLKGLIVTGTTAIAVALLVWSLSAFGPRGIAFAFVVVWLPMAWLGLVSRVVVPRLPDRYHALRGFERDGQLYELLGVRVVKRLLRRGPMALFNPDLHLPTERTPQNLARLDQRMRDAEASHFILLVLTLGVVANALVRRWWSAAGWTLLFDILMNGYPVMLQRYNRALLAKRFNKLSNA